MLVQYGSKEEILAQYAEPNYTMKMALEEFGLGRTWKIIRVTEKQIVMKSKLCDNRYKVLTF